MTSIQRFHSIFEIKFIGVFLIISKGTLELLSNLHDKLLTKLKKTMKSNPNFYKYVFKY